MSRAIESAEFSLRRASAALRDIHTCTDFSSFAHAWVDFLTAHNRAFSALAKWATDDPRVGSWWGRIRRERRSDVLLKYMFQSRNAHEHGIEDLHGSSGPTFVVRLEGPMSIGLRGMRTLGAVTQTSEWLPPKPRLSPVTNRKVTYEPPTMHLGNPIADPTPQVVASYALDYLKGVIADAWELCRADEGSRQQNVPAGRSPEAPRGTENA